MNCWEIILCSTKIRNKCPAYPKKGTDCWKVTGTKCKGGVVEMSSLKEKIKICKECNFFIKYVKKDWVRLPNLKE